MRRNPVLIGMLSCCLALAATATAARPPATVKVAECVIRDDGAGGRSAVFRGEMTALPRTSRMKMRFQVLERAASGEFQAVSTPGLTVWHRSKPGVKTFAYEQRVVGLRSGSAYRAKVDFRWLRADGTTIRRLTRRSGACRQPGALPALAVTDLTWSPGPRTAIASYAVTVANSGGSTARNVRVALRVDGALVDSTDIASLGPGDVVSVSFTGPVCSRDAEAVVDPAGSIREAEKGDNSLTRSCAG